MSFSSLSLSLTHDNASFTKLRIKIHKSARDNTGLVQPY